MLRIILAILAAGILACDDVTGPTAEGGEVALELFKHKDNAHRSTGEGYNFATGVKVKITMVQAQSGIGTITDLDAFSEMIWEPIPGYTMWASPNRIYQPGYQGSYLHLDFKETAEFELVTLSGKTRYKIFAEHRKIGFDSERNGMVSEFVIRYRLLET